MAQKRSPSLPKMLLTFLSSAEHKIRFFSTAHVHAMKVNGTKTTLYISSTDHFFWLQYPFKALNESKICCSCSKKVEGKKVLNIQKMCLGQTKFNII